MQALYETTLFDDATALLRRFEVLPPEEREALLKASLDRPDLHALIAVLYALNPPIASPLKSVPLTGFVRPDPARPSPKRPPADPAP